MMITVKELIEFLQTQDLDRKVLLASDEEGNDIDPFGGCCLGYWIDGEFVDEEDYVELDSPDKCIMFFPA